MSTINDNMGKRIRELRVNFGMSQEELAFRAGITTAHLGQIERNEKNPTIATIAKIADALGIEIYFLFTDMVEVSDERKQKIQQIQAQLEHIPEEQLRLFSHIVDIFSKYK